MKPPILVASSVLCSLLVDGRVTPQDEPITFRYYGNSLLEAEPETEDGRFPYLRAERMVTISEPVTPWVFPFDFLVEVLFHPFVGTSHQSATLQLPENPDLGAEGVEPPGADGVRARGKSARVNR